MGGGITSVDATELNQICTSTTEKCKITKYYSTITNNANFTAPSDEGVYIEVQIGTFTNYGNIIEASGNQAFTFSTNGYISHFINYGNVANSYNMSFWGSGKGISNLTNYGTMGSIEYGGSETMTLNNFGVIKQRTSLNLKATSGKVLIQNYALIINENAETFNKSTYSQSHILASGSVSFKDENSKIILDFGGGFEFDAEYKTANIASGLSVEFSRLVPRSDIFSLSQSGEYFIAKLTPQHSAISNISKSNIRTMNNFYTLSNSMIFPRKSQNLGRKNPSLQTDSANILKSYESFAYRNESINRRIQRQNKRNYNRRLPNQSTSSQNLKENQRNLQNLNTDSANKTNQTNSSLRASEYERGNPQTQSNPQTQTFSQNLAQNPNYSQTPNNYYFILTPFVNHNSFAKSGNYNLSGFDYGFLTAFSAKVAESNHLGTHFIFSYGSLGDSKDKDLSIKSLNLNVGLNYKLDLIYDMYLKARGDFYYFLNQVKTLTMFEAIKPNNLGFGLSVSYGKDFDFGKGGVLGVEAGIDYKALQSSTISLQNNATKTISETYNKALYNLIYVDLGMSYNKYFGGFGINLGTGFKANLAPKLAESILMLNSQNLRFILDNDKYLAYANAGISYVLNTKNFDMEFSLAYYGNFGDRVISNGGGVELRVVF